MGANLNYGSAIPAEEVQTDNCVVEKYCPGDSLSNCTVFGGVYQWDELMQYVSVSNAKGICPPEWHVPDMTEWAQLVYFNGTDGLAGTGLKIISNPSGFEALLHGVNYQNSIWSLMNGPYSTGMFWSSTQYGSSRVLVRGLNTYTQSVSIYYSLKNNALPVRCVHD